MTSGDEFAAVPPRRTSRPARTGPDRYEYKTVRVKNRWSRGQQDQFLNRFAAEGWELMQRQPQGGLLGGAADIVTLRRPTSAVPLHQDTSLGSRIAGWLRGR